MAGSILESKCMCAIFKKWVKKNVKKGEKIENFGKNVQNLKIFWKRPGDCMRLLHTINC